MMALLYNLCEFSEQNDGDVLYMAVRAIVVCQERAGRYWCSTETSLEGASVYDRHRSEGKLLFQKCDVWDSSALDSYHISLTGFCCGRNFCIFPTSTCQMYIVIYIDIIDKMYWRRPLSSTARSPRSFQRQICTVQYRAVPACVVDKLRVCRVWVVVQCCTYFK